MASISSAQAGPAEQGEARDVLLSVDVAPPEQPDAPLRGGFIGNYVGVMSVCGGMLSHLVLGTLYCWGNFQSYTPKEMKNFNGSWNPAQSKSADLLNILPFTLVFQASAMPFGAMLCDRIGPALVVLLAGFLCFSAMVISSFCTTSLALFSLFYAGLLGTGIGLGYTPPLTCGFKHFPDNKGTVSGLILGAFGTGGFIFNKVGSFMFNPKGLGPNSVTKLYPDEVTDAFATTLVKLGFIYLLVILVAAPMIKLPAGGPVAAAASSGYTVKQAIATPTFWIMWAAIMLNAQGGLYVSGSYKGIALDNPLLHNDNYLSTVGALGALSNGLMRPFWGAVSDRIGYRRTFTAIAVLQVVVMIAFPWFLSEKPLFLLGVPLAIANMAGNFAIAPPEAVKIFGNAAVFGCIFTAFAFAGIIGTEIAKRIARASDVGTPQFIYLSLVSFLALVMVQFHPPRARC